MSEPVSTDRRLSIGPKGTDVTASRSETGAPIRIGSRLNNILGPLIALAFVIGLFCLSSEVRPYFLTGGNFKIIFTQSVIVSISALGMTMIIISGGIDLSAGAVIAVTSVIGAIILAHNLSPIFAIAGAMMAGALVGFLNGFTISAFNMMPFIVTLGTMGVARGLALWVSGSETVSIPDTWANKLMEQQMPNQLLPLPIGVWVTLVLAVLVAIVMRQTLFGRYLFAMGGNEMATRLSGVRVGLHKVLVYVIAGVLFGVAGVMQLSRLTQGDPSTANGLELDIIAAVVIGGASLNGGVGSIPGSLIGALIMAVLRNGSSQIGWPTYVQQIIIGAVIIIAVGLDKLRPGNRVRLMSS
jgi:ribose transport system permease protein